MVNHPNRGRAKGPGPFQLPATIKEARGAAGLTQAEAAALIHASYRAWQQWESGERRMHPGLWELFILKVKELSPKE